LVCSAESERFCIAIESGFMCLGVFSDVVSLRSWVSCPKCNL